MLEVDLADLFYALKEPGKLFKLGPQIVGVSDGNIDVD
jgi:hypothetical protein